MSVEKPEQFLPCPCGWPLPPTIKRAGNRICERALRCPNCGLTAAPSPTFHGRLRNWNIKVRWVSRDPEAVAS